MISSKFERSIKCVSLNNRPCQARPKLININFNKLFFIHLRLASIKDAEVATLLMIHIPEYGFQVK